MPRPIRQEITAVDKTQRAFRSVSSSINGLKTSFASLGAVIGVGSFGLLARNSIDAADKVQKLSLRLGASTEALSEYRHVAELSGITFEQLTMGWQRMTRRISEAAVGMGEARGALRELGVSAQTLNQLRPEQQFEVLADALQKVKNPADQVRLAMKLFDSEGVALVQTMKDGSAGIREMREEAAELGLTLDQDTADAAARASDNITRLQSAFQGLGFTLIDVLDGPIEAVSDGLVFLTELLRNSVPDFQQFARALSAINGPAAQMTEVLTRLAEVTQEIAIEEARQVGNIPSARLDRLWEEEDALNAQKRTLDRLIEQTDLLGNRPPAAPLPTIQISGGTVGPDEKVIAQWKKYSDTLQKKFQPAAQTAADELAKLEALLKFQADNNITLIDESIISEAAFDIMSRFTDEVSELDAETSQLQNDLSELGPIIGSAFEDAIVAGGDLGDVLKGLEQDFIRLITRIAITRPLEQALTGFIGSFDFGSIFGRAAGGPVRRNMPYVVGEEGPELFVPEASGSIIPNDALRSSSVGSPIGGEVTVNVINSAPGAQATTRERNEGGNRILDVMIEQVKGSIAGDISRGAGPIPGALNQTYGLNRVAGAY